MHEPLLTITSSTPHQTGFPGIGQRRSSVYRSWNQRESMYEASNYGEIGYHCDIVGQNIATKLKRVSPEMRVHAEKLLNDVMFEAGLGTLHSDAHIHIPYNCNSTTNCCCSTQS